MMSVKPVLIMAGGTGGHVFPALAVADELRSRGVPIVWLGTRKGIEARVVKQAGYQIEWLSITGLRGKNAATLLLAPFALGNRALLDPLLRIGRIETLAWGLVVLAAGALAMGFTMVVAALVGVAMCIAPLPATIGAVALLGCLFKDRGMSFGLLEYLLLVVPVAVFWWRPFLAHGREKVGLEAAAGAAAAPDWQAARIKKLDHRVRALVRPAAALVLAAVFLGGAGFATLGLVAVVAGGLWAVSRERYLLHPSTFDLAVLVTGLLALGWSAGIVTPIVFLVVLWFLHRVESPAQDAASYVRPLRFQPQVESIRYLAAELPDTSRVALEFGGWRHGLNWLLAHALADREGVELLSGVARDQVAPDVAEGYERYMNLEDGAEKQQQWHELGNRIEDV